MTPLFSPEQLQAARRAAAERFTEIATRHTPPDVLVGYRKSLTGRAWPKSRRIEVPRPVTRRALHIYLHEVAHIVLDHRRQKPVHVQELEAEQWAFRVMREEGVPVPRKSLRQAKRYVRRKIRRAELAGAKSIDAKARAWSK